jgi:mRNA interferase MazF
MLINQKELVLLPYPFSNLEETKFRPALVVSNDLFNKKSEDCIMVPLTSVLKEEPCSVIVTQNDLVAGKLIKPSRIKVDKIFAVKKNLVARKIGRINNKVFERVKTEIVRMF